MFLLKFNIIKKRQVNKKIVKQLEFKASENNKEYKIENIYNSVIYTRKLDIGYLLGLYYIIF